MRCSCPLPPPALWFQIACVLLRAPASRAPRAPRTAAQGNNAHTAADPCLEHDYAVENYATCCAHGGYKVEGHKEVCRLAKADLVKKRDQSGV